MGLLSLWGVLGLHLRLVHLAAALGLLSCLVRNREELESFKLAGS